MFNGNRKHAFIERLLSAEDNEKVYSILGKWNENDYEKFIDEVMDFLTDRNINAIGDGAFFNIELLEQLLTEYDCDGNNVGVENINASRSIEHLSSFDTEAILLNLCGLLRNGYIMHPDDKKISLLMESEAVEKALTEKYGKREPFSYFDDRTFVKYSMTYVISAILIMKTYFYVTHEGLKYIRTIMLKKELING